MNVTINPGHVTDRVWAKHLAAARAWAQTLSASQAQAMLQSAESAVTDPSFINRAGGCNHGKQMSEYKARVLALNERINVTPDPTPEPEEENVDPRTEGTRYGIQPEDWGTGHNPTPDPTDLQSVTVTFAIDAPNYEAAVARFTQFMHGTTAVADQFSLLACVVELLPQPGDLAPARYVDLKRDADYAALVDASSHMTTNELYDLIPEAVVTSEDWRQDVNGYNREES